MKHLEASGRSAFLGSAHAPLYAIIVAAALAFISGFAGPAGAHQGNSDFRSVVNGITPGALARGLKAEVVNFDDHVVLENRSGSNVEILGYDSEPYARLLADGRVEVNLNSPTHYLNQDRYADVALPDRADPKARPQWKEVGSDGRFEWHDHRSHYMSEGIPAQVKDESAKTEIFEYRIPLRVDRAPAWIEGTLYWQGRNDQIQILPFLLLGVLVLAGGALLYIRRRRGARDG